VKAGVETQGCLRLESGAGFGTARACSGRPKGILQRPRPGDWFAPGPRAGPESALVRRYLRKRQLSRFRQRRACPGVILGARVRSIKSMPGFAAAFADGESRPRPARPSASRAQAGMRRLPNACAVHGSNRLAGRRFVGLRATGV